MTEILFYHLENQPLERVLPALLVKCLERNWRAVVQTGDEDRLAALDTLLWTFSDESFLPHGVVTGSDDSHQPILLTSDEKNPNDAQVRFLVYGAHLAEGSSYDRVVHLFDGNDEIAVSSARDAWKAASSDGCAVTYWQQDETGRWQKKA